MNQKPTDEQMTEELGRVQRTQTAIIIAFIMGMLMWTPFIIWAIRTAR